MIVATNWDVFLAGACLGAGWVLGSAVAHFAVGFIRGAAKAVTTLRKGEKVAA